MGEKNNYKNNTSKKEENNDCLSSISMWYHYKYFSVPFLSFCLIMYLFGVLLSVLFLCFLLTIDYEQFSSLNNLKQNFING